MLHNLKYFENLLHKKYQENEKICHSTPDTSQETTTNTKKNALQEIKDKYFQKRSANATQTPKLCKIQPLENEQESGKSSNVTSTPAMVKTSILATEETIVSFKQKPV